MTSSSWLFRHVLAYGLCLLGAGLMLLISTVNVHTNVMSGEPVFIEHPWMAWMIAMLAPAASIVLKFVPEEFSGRSKERYQKGLVLVTCLSILAWLVLFALNFTGVNAPIDWGNLGEPDNGKSSALVFVQLLSEILVGAVLYQTAHRIDLIYTPDNFSPNPKYQYTQKALKDRNSELDGLLKDHESLQREISPLRARRSAEINQAVAAYLAARAQNPTR